MNCEKCNKEITEDYRIDKVSKKTPPRFCSKSCSHSRVRTEESKKKTSRSLYAKHGTEPRLCKVCDSILKYTNRSGVCRGCLDSSPTKTRYGYLRDFRERRKKELIEYKGGKCIKCGYNRCIAALEFHHRDPAQKDFTIGNNKANRSKTLEAIKKEVDKCDLLCSNCHREVHYELRFLT